MVWLPRAVKPRSVRQLVPVRLLTCGEVWSNWVCLVCSVKIICVKLGPPSIIFGSVFIEVLSPQNWSQQPRAWMRSFSQFSFRISQLLRRIPNSQLKGRPSLVSKHFSTWMQNFQLKFYMFSSSPQIISAPQLFFWPTRNAKLVTDAKLKAANGQFTNQRLVAWWLFTSFIDYLWLEHRPCSHDVSSGCLSLLISISVFTHFLLLYIQAML